MANDDLKQHINSNVDFYDLLEVPESAQENEIRRAHRKTALKYHPDKVGPANTAALEKFHLLQIAYDVLSDPAVRELYDNARRARQQKAERVAAFEGRRKQMAEELERRESGAFKRKREEVDAEDLFERELRRIAEDGKRRRKVRQEEMRREMLEEQEEERSGEKVVDDANGNARNDEVPIIDRSVSLRFPQIEATKHIDKTEVALRFARFGLIEDVVLRDKKIKVDGKKHRQPYTTVVIVYKSIVGAHAAISDFPKLSKQEPQNFGAYEEVTWAAGKESDYIPKPASTRVSREASPITPLPKATPKFEEPNGHKSTAPRTPANQSLDPSLKKMPSFGSFKGTPAKNSPSLDEITMIRLKNAERRRLEQSIRRDEESREAVEEEMEVTDHEPLR